MINWREYPFIRLLLPFVAGIFLSFYYQDNSPFIFWVSIALFLALATLTIRKGHYQQRNLYGTILIGFLILFGYQLGVRHNQSLHEAHFSQHIEGETGIIAQVKDHGKTTNSQKLLLQVKALEDLPAGTPVCGQLLAYLESDSLSATLRYGDQIYFTGNIQPIAPPKNPKAFDFSRYQANQNVYHQTYIKSGNWMIYRRDQGNPVLAFALSLRSDFLAVLKTQLGDGAELAVASALILGKKDLLDQETKSAYSDTGAMHVLAVSGLHVGLVCFGIGLILGLFPFKSIRWVWIKTWIMVGGVWFFAFLTGAAPSVLRAATMFSFLVVGSAMRHHPSIYNTLAASAFVLLCFNPYVICEVGFQLSYLAVTSIIYFQPKLYGNLYFSNKVLNYIWKLTSVSIAAQIGTLPISLYYFHQFPMYFWLSGLIVIPAATVILGSGILLFFIEMIIPALSFIPGKILFYSLWITNVSVEWISQLPGAVWAGIWIGTGTLLILYLGIGMLLLLINTKKFRWIQALAGLFVLFALNISATKIHHFNDSSFVVYFHKKNLLIDLFDRDYSWAIQNQNLTERDIDFIAKNNRLAEQANFHGATFLTEKGETYCWKYQHGLLRFKDQTLLIIHQDKIPSFTEQIEVDYLLVSDCSKIDMNEVLEKFPSKKLLIAGNNYWKKVKIWKEITDEKGIEIHDIRDQGAFIQQPDY